MSIYPSITLTLLNGFLLIIPLIAARYGIPALVNEKAIPNLHYFPPSVGLEKKMEPVYFATNLFLIFSPLLAQIHTGTVFAAIGWVVYSLGIVVLIVSLLDFSSSEGMVKKGIYRHSRNPIYIGYFMVFMGIGFLIGSWFYLLVALVYQYSTHWLILSEERWCRQTFGESFAEYERKTPRYF